MPHKDPEARREYNRQYRNRPEVRAKRNAANREYAKRPEVAARRAEKQRTPAVKEYQKKYKREWAKDPKNKAKNREYQRKYNQTAKAKETKAKRWAKEETKEYHRQKYREYYAKVGRGYRRHWKAILERDGPVCGICKKPLDPHTEDFEVDHVQPVKHGGTNHIDNLQLAHPYCNHSKSDKWDGVGRDELPPQLSLFDEV